MCIIIATPKRGLVKPSWVDESWRCNRDGGGVAYPLNGLVEIRSGLMTLAEFTAQVEAIPEDSPAILHFRIATSGGVNTKNTHPWRISDRVAMAHNGILSYPHRAPFSDTGSFVHDVLQPMFEKDPDALRSDYFHRWLANYLGSCNSMSFIDGDGKIYNIVGTGNRSPVKDGDVWFSNASYLPLAPTTKWKDSGSSNTSESAVCRSKRKLYVKIHDPSRSTMDGLIRKPITTLGAYHHRYATHAQDRRFLPADVRERALTDMFNPGEGVDTTDAILLGVGITLDARLCAIERLDKGGAVTIKHQPSSGLLVKDKPMTAMSPDYLTLKGTALLESEKELYLSQPNPQDDPSFHIYSGASLTMISLVYRGSGERAETVLFKHNNLPALKSKTMGHKRACAIYNAITGYKNTCRLAAAFDFTATAGCAFVGDEDYLRRRRYLAWDKDTGITFEFSIASGLLSCAPIGGIEIGYIQYKTLGGDKLLIEPGNRLIEMLDGHRVPGDDFTFVCDDVNDFIDSSDALLSLIARDCGLQDEGDLFFEYYAFIEQQDFINPDGSLVEIAALSEYEIYRRNHYATAGKDVAELMRLNAVAIETFGVSHSAGDLVVGGTTEISDTQFKMHCPFDTLMWFVEYPHLNI